MKTRELLLIIVILFIASQLTRFENHLVLSSDGEWLVAKLHNQSIGVNISGHSFNLVNISFQKSMIAENGLRKIRVTDSDGKVIHDFEPFVVYSLGHDVLGTMAKGEYAYFRNTFGDWSMDRFMSKNVTAFSGPLPQKFEIEMVFVGRGYERIFLFGPKRNDSAMLDIADGFIDSNIGMCGPQKCHSVSTYRTESIWLNVRRILNFFFEAAFVGACIMLLIALFGGALKNEA